MIYTVTFNPALDYVVDVEEFSYGMVNRTAKERIYPGGKGINVSIVLKNLGYESVALGFCAGFLGEELKQLIHKTGVKEELFSISGGMTRINVKINSGKETELNGQGPLVTEAEIQKLYEKLNILCDGDILVLSGSTPNSVSKTIYMDIMKYVRKKKVKVIVDAEKELLLNTLNEHPFLIKPNQYELGEIFDVSVKEKGEALIYARKLQNLGAQNVLVSMGGEGAVLVVENGVSYQSGVPQGTVINAVGAGDSMIAGFLAGYLKNENYKEAFMLGICAGSASAFSEELAKKEDVMQLLVRSETLLEVNVEEREHI